MENTVQQSTTQGPWYTSDSAGFDTHGQVMVIDETLGDTVALTYGDPDRSIAQLIAAAPELLAALQWAASVLDVEPADRPRGVFECDLMKVRRALAKAVQS